MHGSTLDPALGSSSVIVNDGGNNATSGIARLQDGRIFAVYCTGNGAQLNASINYQTSADNGATWSGATVLAAPAANFTFADTLATVLSDGTIIVSVMYQANSGASYPASIFKGTTSGGAITWGGRITAGGTTEGTNSSVLPLANGTLLLGTYDGGNNAYVRISGDAGATWGGTISVAANGAGHLWTEATYQQLANGNIIGVLRANGSGSINGYYVVTTTDPTGLTGWSAPTQIFVDPDPGGQSLVLLPSGMLFLFGRFENGSTTDQTGYTWSRDSGVTWAAVQFVTATNVGTFLYGQASYDTVTHTIIADYGLGNFNVGSIQFQDFLP